MNDSGSVPVQSSNIKSLAYDPKTLSLTVHFRSGAVYAYHQVPPATHAALLSSRSKGSFLSEAIRPRFRFTILKH